MPPGETRPEHQGAGTSGERDGCIQRATVGDGTTVHGAYSALPASLTPVEKSVNHPEEILSLTPTFINPLQSGRLARRLQPLVLGSVDSAAF